MPLRTNTQIQNLAPTNAHTNLHLHTHMHTHIHTYTHIHMYEATRTRIYKKYIFTQRNEKITIKLVCQLKPIKTIAFISLYVGFNSNTPLPPSHQPPHFLLYRTSIPISSHRQISIVQNSPERANDLRFRISLIPMHLATISQMQKKARGRQ